MSMRGHRISRVLAILLVGAVSTATAQVSRSTELSWDDGSAEEEFTARPHQMLAVRFQSPPGAWWLTHVRIYVMDDGLELPGQPGVPTTREFNLEVRRPTDAGPGPVAGDDDPYIWTSEWGYAEDAWLEFPLPVHVDLTDEEQFPEGVFYVDIEWQHRTNPVVGLDLDAPIAGETWHWNWASWAVVDTANAMMRAVVSDSSGVPVDLESWGRIKSGYR